MSIPRGSPTACFHAGARGSGATLPAATLPPFAFFAAAAGPAPVNPDVAARPAAAPNSKDRRVTPPDFPLLS
jgi:hypothetical protein